MTAAEKSFIGLAAQSAKDTPNTTDADFVYFLFRNAGVAPQNVIIPLDTEVGGGAMLRDMVKVGVTSGGTMDFIPRPASLGWLLFGALGDVDTTDNLDGSYTHDFTLDSTDQFAAPYFTVRSAPGFLLGEQFQDSRVANLAINFAGARFVDGAYTIIGGLPKTVSTATWTPATYVDDGPQFLGPTSDPIELPTGTAIKVLSGSFVIGMNIPLDEQWVIGSYTPDDFDINQRTMVITFNVKITDAALYKKMMYDPDGGSDWTASLFQEGDIKLNLESPDEAATGVPYALDVNLNTTDDNCIWSAAPIALRAGRQVIMSVTGVVTNVNTGDPITISLTNQEDGYTLPT